MRVFPADCSYCIHGPCLSLQVINVISHYVNLSTIKTSQQVLLWTWVRETTGIASLSSEPQFAVKSQLFETYTEKQFYVTGVKYVQTADPLVLASSTLSALCLQLLRCWWACKHRTPQTWTDYIAPLSLILSPVLQDRATSVLKQDYLSY